MPPARATLERLVIRNAKISLSEVPDQSRLDHELGFDSQAFVALLLDIEDAFDIEIPPERVRALTSLTFGELVGLVQREVPS